MYEQTEQAGPKRRIWPGVAFAGLAIGCAGLTVFGEFFPPWGVATFTRLLLAAAGIAGAIAMFLHRPAWKPLLLIWSIAQIPFIVVDVSGNLTNQLLWCGMSFAQSTAINGQATSVFGLGVNVVGFIYAGLLMLIIRKQWHPHPGDPVAPAGMDGSLRENEPRE